MKVRILGNVRHDNVNLIKYEVYDLPEKDAQVLLKEKRATLEGIDEQTQTRNFTPKKNKVDQSTGMRIPGEFEDDTKRAAERANTAGVKGVEPAATDIKGNEGDSGAA